MRPQHCFQAFSSKGCLPTLKHGCASGRKASSTQKICIPGGVLCFADPCLKQIQGHRDGCHSVIEDWLVGSGAAFSRKESDKMALASDGEGFMEAYTSAGRDGRQAAAVV